MSRLILVRHGQASFLTEDYDRLSEVGEQQSRLLGEWLVRHHVKIDFAYAGPRKRQQDTGAVVAEVYNAHGMDHPAMEIVEDLDECHTDLHMARYVPELGEEFPHLLDLTNEFEQAESHGDKRKTFQNMFDAIMRLYIHERFVLTGLEAWGDFLNRVSRAVDYMTLDAPRASTVIAYTSGGTIAAANHKVLQTPPDPTLEFMWQGRNSAMTEYMFSGSRMSLVCFNTIPHLDDPRLWTHR